MKYNYILLTIGVVNFLSVKSQTDSSKITLDEFEVTTTRVGEKSPIAHENISNLSPRITIISGQPIIKHFLYLIVYFLSESLGIPNLEYELLKIQ